MNARLIIPAAAAAFLAAPAATVFLVRAVEQHRGPAAASAATDFNSDSAAGMRLDDAAATNYLALAEASVAAGFGPDPFDRAGMIDHEPDEAIAEEDGPEPTPEFTVTSVAGAGETAFAVVNGRLFRTGGEVTAGWRIETIDPATGLVHLRSDDGRTVEAALPRPSGREPTARSPSRR